MQGALDAENQTNTLLLMATVSFSSARSLLQQHLSDVEASLGKTLTIIDHRGLLYYRGESLLGMHWQSHRKQAVCDIGFGPACVSHCRLAMNERLQDHAPAVVTNCWKGVREIALGLQYQQRHLGVMYLGMWRAPRLPTAVFAQMQLTNTQRDQWQAAWQALPVWHDADHAQVGRSGNPLGASHCWAISATYWRSTRPATCQRYGDGDTTFFSFSVSSSNYPA